ncbi:DUF2637 domain-containing protein [Mycobacterium adipatum]|uniref:DUF2637 domain-containing protein n=1 Tax=Mycobacterium adipatum TaxID=1682113 RepID=UPI0009EDD261|nr:DUF2637 domain-containing protein [Mycobacterium adipatum]
MTVLDAAPTRNGADLTTTAQTPTITVEHPQPAHPDPRAGDDRPAPRADLATSPDASRNDDARRHALWFFGMWLLFATVVSIGGNVIHAWMTAPESHLKLLAAVAAAVPPAVLLGSSHSVALLIKTRRRGYRRVDAFVLGGALLLTVGVAVCAFAMSFFALRDLMVMLGMSADTAWLWPIAVDLSLICSTLALLSLTSTQTDPHPVRRFGPSLPVVAGGAHAVGRSPAAINTGPSAPAERRVWWESIAGIVREQMPNVRKVADMTNGQLGEILERMYDGGESGRDIVNSTPLHNREVSPIRKIVDGVLERTAPPVG